MVDPVIAVCGACGSAVRVVTTTSCSKLKLDPEPVELGDVVIGEIAGVEVAVRPLSIEDAAGLPMYRTHVRSCSGTVRSVLPINADDAIPAGEIHLERPDGTRSVVVTGADRARPHPFGRRNRGGNPGEEKASSDQPSHSRP